MVTIKGADTIQVSSQPNRRPAAPPPNYGEVGGWLYPLNAAQMPDKSTFPHPTIPGAWTLEDVPTYRIRGAMARNIQGWKLHVSVHPADQKVFFDAIAPKLSAIGIMHKFCPLGEAAQQDLSAEGYAQISADNNNADGKSCVVYPDDPCHLMRVAGWLVGEINAHNATALRDAMTIQQNPDFTTYRPANLIRQHPFGVKGDLRLSKYPYMYTRYGGFAGRNAEHNEVYNTQTGGLEEDKRFIVPYNDFARNIPSQIRAMM